jgi:hypothetical protein
LIRSPYGNLRELAADNREEIKPKLRRHLEKYEAFYFESGYGANPSFDWSVMYRLFRAYRLKRDRSGLFSSLYDPNSEALHVTQRIVETMAKEVRESGSRYTLIVLPHAQFVRRYSDNADFKRRWEGMVAHLCQSQFECIDLMDSFQSVPLESLDNGYDGSHYGPAANSLIADSILESLRAPTAP